jgi:L-lactate dehydrogenase complex protein LldF
VCPAGLVHSRLLLRHRRKNREKDPVFDGAGLDRFREVRYRTFAAAAARPKLWRAMIRGARVAVNRHARNGMVKDILGKSEGWLAERDLPQIGRPTFSEWYKKNKSRK